MFMLTQNLKRNDYQKMQHNKTFLIKFEVSQNVNRMAFNGSKQQAPGK